MTYSEGVYHLMETILICDDERDIVSALSIYLRAEGWQTVCAYSGKEAVHIAQTQNIHIIQEELVCVRNRFAELIPIALSNCPTGPLLPTVME